MQISRALAYRAHFAEIGDNTGEHDLTANEIFDRVRCKLLTSAQCEPAGHPFDWHALQRADPRIADRSFAAYQDCLVHEVRCHKTRRNDRPALDQAPRDPLLGQLLENLVQVEPAFIVVDTENLA